MKFANSAKMIAAAALGALSMIAGQSLLTPRATSEESHVVWNYIVDSKASPEIVDKFNHVNSNWPPAKAEMGMVLLEAKMSSK